MDNKIDSRPCAADHSSPRSPLQVLRGANLSMTKRGGKMAIIRTYPRIDLDFVVYTLLAFARHLFVRMGASGDTYKQTLPHE